MQRDAGVQLDQGQQGSLLPSRGIHQVVLNCHLENSERQRAREREKGGVCVTVYVHLSV